LFGSGLLRDVGGCLSELDWHELRRRCNAAAAPV
jgi:hypothetical protein